MSSAWFLPGTAQNPYCQNDVVLSDGLGATAADSVEAILGMLENQELTRIWKEVSDHE